jgi:hypothetical protein
MRPVCTVDEVFQGIQSAKSGAVDFRTNFFPVRERLHLWIAHGELASVDCQGVTFFFRKDRDFWHFYFCATSLASLQREATTLSELKTEPMVTDLVGSEPGLGEMSALLQCAGFRSYARLQRMARAVRWEESRSVCEGLQVGLAEKSDGAAILNLLERSFNHYAEQLPTQAEVELAIERQQIFAVKIAANVAGILFFETHGVTSSLRFWVVDERFRTYRAGSALMLYYFKTQRTVRRFTLWVNTENANAILKYGHYGYAQDGLMDHVLANKMIPS